MNWIGITVFVAAVVGQTSNTINIQTAAPESTVVEIITSSKVIIAEPDSAVVDSASVPKAGGINLFDLIAGDLKTIFRWFVRLWLLWVFLVIVYLHQHFRYKRLARVATQALHLAPIQVRGKLASEVGSQEAGKILKAHFEAIIRTLVREADRDVNSYMAPAVALEFRNSDSAIRGASVIWKPSKIEIPEEWVVSYAGIKVSLSSIVNLSSVLLQKVPMRHRSRYLNALVQVSVVSHKDQTQVTVTAGAGTSSPRVTTVTRARRGSDLNDLSELLREAAFTIMELHGGTFPEKEGRSMRFFVEGLNMLGRYRKNGQPKFLENAKNCFAEAIAYQGDHYEALYFYGCLLLGERKRPSIARARELFFKAKQTENLQLRALVHAGLANCYAQMHHRLAICDEGVLGKAQEHADHAMKCWKESSAKEVHPWLLATQAVIAHVDEGTPENRQEAVERYVRAAGLYLEAIRVEPTSEIYRNALGWVLLKLTEWGIVRTDDLKGMPKDLHGTTAAIAERYFREAKDMNPGNKLVQANLCLLYSHPPFINDRDIYLPRCHAHGLRAVKIDRSYVNGYRDLAFSLARYGEYETGRRYFNKALEYADIEKDQELLRDAKELLKDLGPDQSVVDSWLNPDPELLIPHDEVEDPRLRKPVPPGPGPGI